MLTELLQRIKRRDRSSLEKLTASTMRYVLGFRLTDSASLFTLGIANKHYANSKNLLIQERMSKGEIQDFIRCQRYPENTWFIDFCSGMDVRDPARETYPRKLAQQYQQGRVYCVDIDFGQDSTDETFPNLHYLAWDFSEGKLPVEHPGANRMEIPLVFTGLDMPGELGTTAVRLTAQYRPSHFVGSISGIEYLAGEWAPSSKALQNSMMNGEEKAINGILARMQGLVSPLRHDYDTNTNEVITMVKQLVTLDLAVYLEENGYRLRVLGRNHLAGPQNWSWPDMFVVAENITKPPNHLS